MAGHLHTRAVAEAPDEGASAKRMSRVQSAISAHAVTLIDSDAVGKSLATILPAWGISADTAPETRELPEGDTASVIRKEADGHFSFQSHWGDSPLTGLGIAGATCGAVADLVQAHVDARAGIIGLHCGAVRIGAHLVAFTGTYRAGKSTLVTRLGLEEDCALFCDDILPIDARGTATALGVQPRLRLPLPEGVTPAFRNAVARCMTISDHRYGYVDCPGQVPFGVEAPLAAMVVLHRQEGARARLHRLETSQAAAFLIRQNIADPGDPEAHYDRISNLAEGLVCVTLVYSDLQEAVTLIKSTLGAYGIAQLQSALEPPLLLHEEAEAEAAPAALGAVYSRAGDVITRRIGSDTFLWQMDGRNFFSLNPIGGAIWTLLETPQSGTNIVATLQEIFTEIPPKAINEDVAKLLGQLTARSLVHP